MQQSEMVLPQTPSALLADVLAGQRETVIQLWLGRLRGDQGPAELRGADEPVLREHVCPLLDEVIAHMDGREGGPRANHSSSLGAPVTLQALILLRAVVFDRCFHEALTVEREQVNRLLDELDRATLGLVRDGQGAANADEDADLRMAAVAEKCGSWSLRPRTGELFWDAECRRIVGFEPTDHADYASFLAVIHPEDRARVEEAVRRALDAAGGGEYSAEYRVIDRSGKERWIEVHGAVSFDEADTPERFWGTVLEITDHKRRELSLAAANARSEHFLGILAHDLRNPLSTILSAAGLIQRRESLPEGVERLARRVAGAAERMGKLVSDILDVTRSRLQGGLPVALRPVDLARLCRAVVDELATAHPHRVLKLDTRGRVHGTWDPDRLAQLLSNLLGNALSHSPSDTQVRVEVWARAGAALIAIHNEGAPIPPEIRAELFEPPWRATPRPPLHEGSSGLGLGLYISREIVHAHGGTIAVDSGEAEGTTVRVSLPRARHRKGA